MKYDYSETIKALKIFRLFLTLFFAIVIIILLGAVIIKFIGGEKMIPNQNDTITVEPFDKTIDLYKNPTLKNICSEKHLGIDYTEGIECGN